MRSTESPTHGTHVYRLIERCKAAISAVAADDGKRFSLVLAGGLADLQVALSECTEFELYNAVCQRANVYPSENALLSNLRRGRLLDALLSRSGRRQFSPHSPNPRRWRSETSSWNYSWREWGAWTRMP